MYNYFFSVVRAGHNGDGAIVIKNTVPSAWQGRKYDVGIMRDQRFLVKRHLVHVGDQAVFDTKPILYFSVTRNMSEGEDILIKEVLSYDIKVDLREYASGLHIFLTKSSGGGRYRFKAEHRIPC